MYLLSDDSPLQRIFHEIRESDTFVSKYECLCLLRLENEVEENPLLLLPGLQKLVADIVRVLDDYIRSSQSLSSSENIAHEDLLSLKDMEEEEEEGGGNYSPVYTGVMRNMRKNRSQFEAEHRDLIRTMDEKLSVLLCIEDCFEEYFRRILFRAKEYHIRYSETLLNTAIQRGIQGLKLHKYFDTKMVNYYFSISRLLPLNLDFLWTYLE